MKKQYKEPLFVVVDLDLESVVCQNSLITIDDNLVKQLDAPQIRRSSDWDAYER